jgi:hypothetical protein
MAIFSYIPPSLCGRIKRRARTIGTSPIPSQSVDQREGGKYGPYNNLRSLCFWVSFISISGCTDLLGWDALPESGNDIRINWTRDKPTFRQSSSGCITQVSQREGAQRRYLRQHELEICQ